MTLNAMIAAASKALRPARLALGAGMVFAALSANASAGFVPEIDPGSMGSAVTLLAGGLVLLTGRRSK